MKILIFCDVETEDIWYYALDDGEKIPVLIYKKEEEKDGDKKGGGKGEIAH